MLLNTATGQHLSSDKKHIIRNDFDVEWEVCCHSYKDFGTRIELKQNVWQFLFANHS
jgi:hypothetical protein